MASISIALGGGKKQLVKTTPVMILREVVNNVCEKQGYTDPEGYGLKYGTRGMDQLMELQAIRVSGRNFLDLSLSIRHANIAPGAKLELARVPKAKSAPTHVDLALQLEDGGRRVQSFAITTTLWDVLLGFEKESNGSLNLTRRTTVPQSASTNIFSLQQFRKAKPATEVYVLPVVILLEREYVSIKTLKTTTLQLAGLLKGNAVFRVMMRLTDAGIEDFLEEIERDYPRPAEAPRPTETSRAEPAPEQSLAPVSKSAPRTEWASCTVKELTPPSEGTNTLPFTSTTVRQYTDKTAGEMDFTPSRDSYQGGSSDMGINSQGVQTPGITGRSGTVDTLNREGNVVAPPQGAGPEIDIQRQSPLQEMNAAIIEAHQEVRQLREQQTQAALTDRVKYLSSKVSDRSDRERFVRSVPPGTFTEEPISEIDDSQPPPSSQNKEDLVRQIAHRVSMQMKKAQERGTSITDYRSLIEMEIEKEQIAGSLPGTPTGSRHSTIYKGKAEQEASPRLVAMPEQSKSSTTVEESVDRHVKVFRPPADDGVPLSNKIDLPDDFYTLTTQDMVRLMDSQKAKREEEENRGFKTAAMRAEEDKARERRYPKTIVRVRFPDRVQIQATFSSQETIADLRQWVTDVCVGQGEKFDLYISPPRKVLTDNKQTLYQAGLTPQSIVYFSWADSKLNQSSPFLNGTHMAMMEDLPIPGADPEPPKPAESVPDGSTPSMTTEDRRLSQRMSTDKPGNSSTTVPKWVKLAKK
ncbi:Tether containing UBX domain for GLUT4 [Mortierella sp. GBA43]|nr:Tether containing UBX domain for GLUT4 [Mortierella sp. GBA43]